MTWGRYLAIGCAMVVLGCRQARENRLIWEGAGAPSVRTVTETARILVSSVPGVRVGEWGESPDATYQILDVEVAEEPHVHEHHDLSVILLRGEGVLVVAERRYQVGAGDVIHVARGRPHHFQPRGRALGLAVYTPGLQGKDYRRVEK